MTPTPPPTPATGVPFGWDEWVAAQRLEGGFLQSTAWAEMNQRVNRAIPHFLAVEGVDRRAAGLLVFHHPPAAGGGASGLLRRRLTAAGSGRLVSHDGPVLAGRRPEVLDALLDATDELAAATGVRSVWFGGFPAGSAAARDDDLHDAFRAHGYRVDPWATSLVDLTLPRDEMEKRLKSETRKALRRAGRVGLTVSQCASAREFRDDVLAAFYEGRRAQGLAVRTDGADEEMWRDGADAPYRFFVCRDADGVVLAVLGSYRFGGRVTEVMSGRSLAGLAVPHPAQDLVHWEAFAHHANLGDQVFDLAGFNPAPVDDKEAGIRRFKEKWGGETVEVRRWERAVEPAVTRVGRALRARSARTR